MNGCDIDSRAGPFHLNPDPRYFYCGQTHRRVLAGLLSGIDNDATPVLLTGKSGTGKTSLIHKILIRLPPESYTLLLRYTTLNATDLVRLLASELGILPAEWEDGDLLATVREKLLAIGQEGAVPVVIVDDAQNLCRRGLNTLCELTRDGAIKLVLVGQPQLPVRIAMLQAETASARSTTVLELEDLCEAESRELVCHRLRVAGMEPAALFSPPALGLIYEHTQGNPRRINLFCDRAIRMRNPPGTPEQALEALREAASNLKAEMYPAAAEEPRSRSADGAGEQVLYNVVDDEIIAEVSAETENTRTLPKEYLTGSEPSPPSRRNKAIALAAMLLLFALTAWLIEAQFSGEGLAPAADLSSELSDLRTQVASLNEVVAAEKSNNGALQEKMTALRMKNHELREQIDQLVGKRVLRGQWQAPVIEDFATLETAQAFGQEAGAVEYQVRAGDTLIGIAHRHQLSLSQIARWNGLSTSARLRVGERLVLSPRDELNYTVRWGDTLVALKRQFDVTFGELRRWNELPKDGRLYAGQRLRVFVSLPADS